MALTGTDAVAINGEISVSPSLSPHGDFSRPVVPQDDSQATAGFSSVSNDNDAKNADFSTVPANSNEIRVAGIEPARPFGQRILSP